MVEQDDPGGQTSITQIDAGKETIKKVGNTKALIVGLSALAVLFGGMSLLAYKKRSAANPNVSKEEAQVAGEGAKSAKKAGTLASGVVPPPLGQDLQFDNAGNLAGARTRTSNDIPENQSFNEAEQRRKRPGYSAGNAGDQIEQGIDYSGARQTQRYQSTGSQPTDTESVKAYSQAHRDEIADIRESHMSLPVDTRPTWQRENAGSANGSNRISGQGSGAASEELYRKQMADTKASLTQAMSMQAQGGPAQGGGSTGMGGTIYPATQSVQVARMGEVADMRIGGGPEYTIPEGKFIDVTTQNKVNVSNNENPVVAMVTRDIISPDGKWVLVPSGSIITAVAGRVQTMEQERVFIPGHRIRFPNGRVAYFPERNMSQATSLEGELGVPGKVNRHWFLRFGSAIALGMIEGYANYQAGPVTTTPLGGSVLTPRQSAIQGATSNFNAVVTRLLDLYANIPPNITLPIGTRMKFYFSQDVRVSGYMPTENLFYVGKKEDEE